MQIQVETVYSLPVLTAMARALRKTLRRKKSRRTRIFSVVLMLIALLTIVLSLTTDPSFPGHHQHGRADAGAVGGDDLGRSAQWLLGPAADSGRNRGGADHFYRRWLHHHHPRGQKRMAL